jgi:two-component system nitrate/nitrite response regulator NarL
MRTSASVDAAHAAGAAPILARRSKSADMSARRARTRILIADDHLVVRAGLRQLLKSASDFIVVGEAVDGSEAVALTASLCPDVLLIDLAMPGVGGLEALRTLADVRLPVRPIVLTASLKRDEMIKALQLGARAIVLKDVPGDLLFSAIRTVMAGRYWVGRESAADLTAAPRTFSIPKAQPVKSFGLTPRQLDVVSSVGAGLTNKEIAARLSVSEQTVKHHLTQIFDKLGVSSRVELAVFATHHGFGV